jgi:hypothetical protein
MVAVVTGIFLVVLIDKEKFRNISDPAMAVG